MNGVSRVILIVLDSAGIGALPDAAIYDDEEANTLVHIGEAVNGLKLPNLEKLGLGKIAAIDGLSSKIQAEGAFGKMAEASPGKDTTTGHWELAGIILKEPFPTYPDGFPSEVIEPFQKAINSGILGNRVASGTKIIEELGRLHIKTAKPIVYTSADSVFQIAAHEDIIPGEQLYDMCKKARRILTGKHAVGRVIARPFIGEPGNFTRTEGREDFSLEPPGETVLDKIKKDGQSVMSVGKIADIFAGKGITSSNHTVDNMDSVDATLDYMDSGEKGLIFANLVEFDMIYGHRRNVEGYARALEELDNRLPEIIERLEKDDILIITADHGCDPTYKGTDHTREFVPVLVYGERVKPDIDVATRSSFADLAATVSELLGCEMTGNGASFASEILW